MKNILTNLANVLVANKDTSRRLRELTLWILENTISRSEKKGYFIDCLYGVKLRGIK